MRLITFIDKRAADNPYNFINKISTMEDEPVDQLPITIVNFRMGLVYQKQQNETDPKLYRLTTLP